MLEIETTVFASVPENMEEIGKIEEGGMYLREAIGKYGPLELSLAVSDGPLLVGALLVRNTKTNRTFVLSLSDIMGLAIARGIL